MQPGMQLQDGREGRWGGWEAGRTHVAPGGHLSCPWSLVGVVLRAMLGFYTTNKGESISLKKWWLCDSKLHFAVLLTGK